MGSRDTDLLCYFTDPLFNSLKNAKVLVVGAGGIGCELIKNLVLSGFQNIDIIDLDTIDISNLNRQFLFRKEHVGLSKAQVAREAALSFNPSVKIKAYHKNIKSAEFGLDYFKQFELVMNALDNLDARRHVNRMCLSANIPLLESGTAGYLGQVTVIKKGSTECFECQPRPTPKTYPVCTIRSNPTSPIHCIVWAKYLFERLFGKQDDANAVTDLEDVPTGDQQALAEKAKGFQFWIFHKVFFIDIEKLAKMEDLWKGKSVPIPLSVNTNVSNTTPSNVRATPIVSLKDQLVWSVEENIAKFLHCTAMLHTLRGEIGELSWDKDDAVALDFVTAASNLRATIFGIPLQSRFDVKEKAGNIIAAIATTNAVIAGLIVVEAVKIIRGALTECRGTYLQKRPSRKRLLLPTALEVQNPACYVCSRPELVLRINTQTATIGDLVDLVLRNTLGMLEPTILVESDIVFESGEDVEPDFVARQTKKRLSECKICHNSILMAEDFLQDLSLHITIKHDDITPDTTPPFEIIGNISLPTSQANNTSNTTSSADRQTSRDDTKLADVDECEIVEAPPPQAKITSSSKKRPAPDTK